MTRPQNLAHRDGKHGRLVDITMPCGANRQHCSILDIAVSPFRAAADASNASSLKDAGQSGKCSMTRLRRRGGYLQAHVLG
jgi:hypothetical protein